MVSAEFVITVLGQVPRGRRKASWSAPGRSRVRVRAPVSSGAPGATGSGVRRGDCRVTAATTSRRILGAGRPAPGTTSSHSWTPSEHQARSWGKVGVTPTASTLTRTSPSRSVPRVRVTRASGPWLATTPRMRSVRIRPARPGSVLRRARLRTRLVRSGSEGACQRVSGRLLMALMVVLLVRLRARCAPRYPGSAVVIRGRPHRAAPARRGSGGPRLGAAAGQDCAGLRAELLEDRGGERVSSAPRCRGCGGAGAAVVRREGL